MSKKTAMVMALALLSSHSEEPYHGGVHISPPVPGKKNKRKKNKSAKKSRKKNR